MIIIFVSLLTMFELRCIFEAVETIAKICSSLKSNRQFKLSFPKSLIHIAASTMFSSFSYNPLQLLQKLSLQDFFPIPFPNTCDCFITLRLYIKTLLTFIFYSDLFLEFEMSLFRFSIHIIWILKYV